MTMTSSAVRSDRSAPSATAAAGDARTCEWEKFVDDSSQTPYYFNARTGESSWSEPEGFVDKSSASKLPSVWRKFIDESTGTAYYYDKANDATQWEKPDGFVDGASDDEESASDGDADGDDGSDGDTEGAKATSGTTKEADDDAKARTSQDQEAAALEQTEDAASEDNASTEEPSGETASATGDESRASSDASAVLPEAQATPATAGPQQTPPNWVKHMDRASGRAYYHDTVSGVTQWEAPAEFVDAPPMAAAAVEYHAHLHRVQAERMARVTRQVLDPTGSLARLSAVLSTVNASTGTSGSGDATGAPKAEWQQHVDPHTQRFYYHNVVTGVTQWHKPDAPISSGLADWIPPETTDPTETGATRKTVSGVAYAATAKFNRVSGKFESGGSHDDSALSTMPFDRAGRQMSHFFDMTALEKNRADAKVLKEKLKRQHIDWKKVAAEKKAKKQKQKNEWLYQE